MPLFHYILHLINEILPGNVAKGFIGSLQEELPTQIAHPVYARILVSINILICNNDSMYNSISLNRDVNNRLQSRPISVTIYTLNKCKTSRR